VHLLVEGRRQGLARSTAAPPSVEGVPHDPKEPRLAVPAAEGREILERAQAGVLHDVLRLVVITGEMPREIEGGIQVRQHRVFEFGER
jgi:hypothetical protein